MWVSCYSQHELPLVPSPIRPGILYRDGQTVPYEPYGEAYCEAYCEVRWEHYEHYEHYEHWERDNEDEDQQDAV